MMTSPEKPAPPEDERPLLAPCVRLHTMAPLAWLREAWSDYLAAPAASLIYGSGVLILSAIVTAFAWWLGRFILVLVMLSGFVFVAPLLATGLYSISRQVHRGQRASLQRSLSRMRSALGNAMIFALVLMIIFLVWARAASMVHIFFPADAEACWWGLARFLLIGSAVGSVFALFSFSAAAFSLPMIVDRDVDMITAVVTSVNAVLRNKPAMAVWIAVILVLTVAGFVTLGLGLILVVPLLGYATWHGYEATIDASDWPENPVATD